MDWLKELFLNFRSRRITFDKINEAYLLQDSRYLRKAFRYSRDYKKVQVAILLAKITTQENFDFLLSEMKLADNIQVKSYAYYAAMNICSNENIIIKDDDEEYLYTNFDLFNNIGVVNEKPRKFIGEPILLRNKLKNHLQILEDMKKEFHSL